MLKEIQRGKPTWVQYEQAMRKQEKSLKNEKKV